MHAGKQHEAGVFHLAGTEERIFSLSCSQFKSVCEIRAVEEAAKSSCCFFN